MLSIPTEDSDSLSTKVNNYMNELEKQVVNVCRRIGVLIATIHLV